MSRARFFLASLALVLLVGALWYGRRTTPVAASAPIASTSPAAPAAPPAVSPAPATSSPAAPAAQPRETDPVRLLAEIPPGPFRDSLLKLDEPARQRALAKLIKLGVPREDYASLRAGPGGALLYICEPPPGAAKGAAKAAAMPGSATDASSAPTVSAASVPIAIQPIHHSKPGAPNVLYLDFNGFTITGTFWNTYYGPATYKAVPFDTDGDPSTFSDAEQAAITQIWERVAEDYAPFNVDVTTEEPAVFTSTTGRAVITKSVDANGVTMPSNTAGGVAWLDVFGGSDYVATYSPALIYYNNLGSRADYIAEATAHELGHNLGLSHDGVLKDPSNPASVASEYYSGHGSGDISWAPIMGAPYDHNVTQWTKGEYYLSNNISPKAAAKDEITYMSGYLGFRTDEAGGTIATTAVTTVTGTAVSAAGILSSSTDVDVFAVSTAAGTVSFSVKTYKAASGSNGGDADIKLDLLDAAGNPLTSNNPAASPNASVSYIAAAPTTYYLRLTPAGTGTPLVASPTGYTSYASIGQYTITGTIVPTAPAIVGTLSASIAAGQPFSYAVTATNSPTTYSATGLPAGLGIDAGTGLITGRATAAGLFNVTVTATNTQGTGNATLAVTVTDAPPVITAQTSGSQIVATGGSLTLSATAISANGAPTYQWKRSGFPLVGATASTLTLSPATVAASGYYQLLVTNSIGTTVSAPIFVRVAPGSSQVVGWGSNAAGQLTFPSDLTTLTDIAAGSTHVLALKADGTVVGWGSNTNGQTTIPATLANVVAIATGQDFSVALKADGTVSAWGLNSAPQGTQGQTSVPSNLNGVVAISAGGLHSLAVKSDGTVRAWGSNAYSQITLPASLTSATAVAVAAGGYHSLALLSDGTVVGWGRSDNTNNFAATIPAGLTNIVAIAAGDNFSLALKSDGTVVAWGLGVNGQTTVPAGLANVTAIAAGSTYAFALKADGTVTSWGLNAAVGGVNAPPTWLDHAIEVKAGTAYSLALRDVNSTTTPVFATLPQSQTVTYGVNATFFVGVAGALPITCQWQSSTDGTTWGDLADGGNYSGVATPTLLVSGATLNLSGRQFRCIASNSFGSVPSSAATLTITKAALTITANDQTRAYNTANPTFTLSYSGFVNSDTVAAITLPTAKTEAGLASPIGPYAIMLNGGSADNYTLNLVAGTLTVTSSAQAIAFAPPADKTYGAAPFDLSATAGSGLPVNFAILSGPAVLSGSTLTITGIGGITVRATQAGNANYGAAPAVDRSFTVGPAVLTVTATDLSRPYQSANPTLTFSYSGFVNGENDSVLTTKPAITTTANFNSHAGPYPITLTGGSAANYTLSRVAGILTVAPAAQTITFGGLAGQTYGAAPFTLSATADSGLPVSFAVVSGPATIAGTMITLTGAGAVTVRATQAGSADYAAATPVDRSFTIAPAPLTITAVNQSRAYGAVDPVFTLNYTGFVNGDTAALLTSVPAAATTATATSPAGGAYPITLIGGSAANYTLTLASGTLTITPALLTVTAADQSRVYNTANPTLTFGYSGFVNSENATILNAPPTIATTAGLSSPVGTYPITLSGGSAANYTLKLIPGTLTVTLVPQTITFNAPADRVYGAAPFALGATANSGLRVNYAVLSGPATISGSALIINGAGLITVRASQSGDAVNGPAPDVDRSFTVTPAPLTVTAVNQSRLYGAANPTLTLTYSGFVYGETALTSAPVAATSATVASPVTTYLISITGGSGANYTITRVPGTLTVTPAPLTAKADNQSRIYNTPNPPLTITYTGFVNNDSAGLITPPDISTAATLTTTVGSYPITLSGGTAVNYNLTRVPGTLTIAGAPNVITFNPPGGVTVINQPFDAAATASSGLPVSFSVFAGPATLTNGHTVTITGAGTVTIRAAQAGDANYLAAVPVDQTFVAGKASQQITFAALADRAYNSGSFDLVASSDSVLPVAFTVVSGPATLSGNTVTFTGIGLVTIHASQAGDANYTPAVEVEQSFTVTKDSQTITIQSPESYTYGDAPPYSTNSYVIASASSGLPVTLAVVSGPATVTDNIVTLTGAGTVTLRGSQAGDGLVNAAPDLTYSFLVKQAGQTISFGPISDKTLREGPFVITAGTDSNLPVAFNVVNGPATISGSTVTLTGIGLVTIRASQAGDANYKPAADVEQSFNITKDSQTITIQSPESFTYGDPPFYVGGNYVSASASSGLPVTLTVVSGPATVVNNIVTLTGAGTVMLRGSQAGDGFFNPAPDQTYSFLVKQAGQTIGFAAISNTTLRQGAFTIAAGTDSNLPVTFTVVSGPATVSARTIYVVGAATLTRATVTPTGIGTVTIRASQAGDANYKPAADVEQSFTVTKDDQTITIQSPESITYGDSPSYVGGSYVVANASSGLPVTLAVVSGPASVTNNVVAVTGAGTVVVRASQTGDANYNAAAEVDRTFTVAKHSLTITAGDKTRSYGTANPPLTLTCAGFVGSDTVASITPPAISTSADGTYPSGSYPITLTGGAAANYTLALVNGTLTITRAENIITFNPLNGVTFGDAPFEIGATASSGLAVTFNVVSGPATLGNGHTVTVTGPGAVTIRAMQAGNANYLPAAAVDQSFTVGRASQQITFAVPADRTYGAAPFAVNATADSALPVTFAVVSGPATVANGVVTLTGAGPVTLRASQAGNATFIAAPDVERSFTVNKAPLTVVTANQTRAYGAANPVFGLTYNGFVNNETAALITAPTVVTTATAASPVGAYPIALTGGAAANYAFTFTNGVLTITKAPLTVTAVNQTRLYGEANPTLTVSYSGFVNNDTVAAVTAPAISTTATTASAIGTYPITLTGGAAANYTLTLVSGTLTITRRDYKGTYFGTFGSGGHWALYVRGDNTASYLAYLPSRSSAVVVSLTVNADGTFNVASTEIKPLAATALRSLALATAESPITPTAAATPTFTLAGQIGADGAVTGQLTGLNETFTGAADAATGPAQSNAGYYTASALGTTSGATYAIVSPTGQAFVVTTGSAVDSASGTVSASGQLSATTTANAALALTIDAAGQTVAASVTPAGSSTPISYAGLPDTVVPVARVVNLSVRSTAGSGDQTLIVGVVIGGGNKTLLIRGVGPGIAGTVPNALTDPKLRLLDSHGAEIEANDDWDSSLVPTFNALGAQALVQGSKDAAIYRVVPAGLYSCHVFPSDNTSGVALAELYDGDGAEVPAQVVNISARTEVGTGDAILIAGFVIVGNSPKTLLIRGQGPSLVGVSGVLADPQLYLFNGNTVITSNDNWGGTTELKAAFSTVGAGALASDNSKDAALLVTLKPGIYSAQVSGVGDSTGVGLVEIFLMP